MKASLVIAMPGPGSGGGDGVGDMSTSPPRLDSDPERFCHSELDCLELLQQFQ